LLKARQLEAQLKLILAGEAPYYVFEHSLLHWRAWGPSEGDHL